MSTISAVIKDNKICIASESLVTFGATKLRGEFVKNQTKILSWGSSLVGTVGSVAISTILNDLIAHEKEVPDFSNVLAIYRYFRQLHPRLKEEYFVNPNTDEEDPVESSQFEIVIANRHGLFGVHSLRDVYDFTRFWAYGSGKDFALGAMNALYPLDGFDAEQVAIAGVQAGITFDDGSDGEVVVRTIELG